MEGSDPRPGAASDSPPEVCWVFIYPAGLNFSALGFGVWFCLGFLFSFFFCPYAVVCLEMLVTAAFSQFHLFHLGHGLERNACLGPCEGGWLSKNGEGERGNRQIKISFERRRAALRHSEGKGPDAGEILGARHGRFTEHVCLSRMEKVTTVMLQMGTGRSCWSPRASRTLLRPGFGNRHPGEGSVAACSPEVHVCSSIAVSQASAVHGCTGFKCCGAMGNLLFGLFW